MQEQLDRIEKLVRIGAKEVLNVEEVALLLGISKNRVYHLTCTREIPYYKNGKNVCFKKSEIEEWRLRERIPTKSEIDSKAATYIATHQK